MKIDLTCPAEVWRCAMPQQEGDPCELTVYNLAEKSVTSFEVTLVFVGTDGEELTRVVERVRDIHLESEKWVSVAVSLPEKALSLHPVKMEVSIDKIWYEDNSVWRKGRNPLTEYRSNALPKGRELDMLRYAAGENAIGFPELQGQIWMCICGRPNSIRQDFCVRCHRLRRDVFENYGRDRVTSDYQAARKALDAGSREALSRAGDRRSGRKKDFIVRKRSHAKAVFFCLLALLLAAAVFVGIRAGAPYIRYRQAVRLMESGSYTEAREAFSEMDSYRDAQGRALQCRYREGEQLLQAQTVEEIQRGRTIFIELGDYADSAGRVKEADYLRAGILLAEGETNSAREIYLALGDYRDSAAQVKVCEYAKAEELQESGDFDAAHDAYVALGDYADSADKALQCYYAPGKAALTAEDADTAIQCLEKVRGYQDADSLLQRAYYLKGEQLLELERPAEAGEAFLMAGDYKDALDRGRSCIYEPAEAALESGDYETAAVLYQKILDYRDSGEKAKKSIVQAASAAMEEQEYARAQLLLEQLPEDYENREDLLRECIYQPSVHSLEEKDWGTAVEGFEALGEYRDSTELLQQARYGQARQLETEKEWADAAELYEVLGDYQDSRTRLRSVRYTMASSAYADGEWERAISLYAQLGKYRQSDSRLAQAQYHLAEEKTDAGDFVGARDLYAALGNDYQDAAEKVKACDYAIADAQTITDPAGAAEKFAALGEYADSAQRAQALWYDVAFGFEADGNLRQAVLCYQRAGEYQDAQARITALQDKVYGPAAELAQAAIDSGNPAAAASILSKVDLTALPESYAGLTDLYRQACYAEGRRLVTAGEQELAYPYLQRCRGYEKADELLDRFEWNILGTWRAGAVTVILHRATTAGMGGEKHGTITIDAETLEYSLSGTQQLVVDGKTAFKVASLNGDRMILRDVRAEQENVLNLERTAPDVLAPLPEISFSTMTDLPAVN